MGAIVASLLGVCAAATIYKVGSTTSGNPFTFLDINTIAQDQGIKVDILAVRMTKEIVLRGRELPLNNGLRIYRELNELIHLTEDTTEGAKAWAERRPARYAAR